MNRLPDELEAFAWNTYRELLPLAEDLFGPRQSGFAVEQIVHSGTGPEMQLLGNSITLILGPNAVGYRPTLVSNIAHEVVHTLNPRVGNANTLEEGAAVYFELDTIKRRYGDNERMKFWNCLPDTYKDALANFEHLYDHDENPAFAIRKRFGSFSTVTSDNLLDMYNELPVEVATRLAERKRMRPNAT